MIKLFNLINMGEALQGNSISISRRTVYIQQTYLCSDVSDYYYPYLGWGVL